MFDCSTIGGGGDVGSVCVSTACGVEIASAAVDALVVASNAFFVCERVRGLELSRDKELLAPRFFDAMLV